MKKRYFVLFIALLLSSVLVHSHGNGEGFTLEHSELYPLSQLAVVGYGAIGFGILILVIIMFHKVMNEIIKKAVYILLAVLILTVTVYLIATTIHLNFISLEKGPVHWHADFEIWICDKEIKLEEAKGLSNKQGVSLMHAHEDNRVHVEGVILDKKQASLGAFFYAVDGMLTNDGLKVPTNEGLVSVHDGDLCNGQPSKLYVFVNGKLIDNAPSYAISPYEKVPPGDRIKFVFTEKPIEEINPSIN